MRRFEEQYRINEGDDVLSRENAIHQDVDLRLDAIELLGQAFAAGNRADIEALIAAYRDTVSGLAKQVEDLLGEAEGGISANAISETADRLFFTAARRAAILAELRDGVDASGDTMAKLLALIVGVVGGAPAGRQNLKAINDAVVSNTTALNAILTGADPLIDTFAEIAAKFTSQGSALTEVMSAIGNRLRGDADGGYSASQVAQFLANLGLTDRQPGVGDLVLTLGSSAPAGCLKLNGPLLNRAGPYAPLWAWAQANARIVADNLWTGGDSFAFSSGDGSATFRLPDARGEFGRFWDDNRGLDTGRTIGSIQAAAILSHTHTFGTGASILGGGGGTAANLATQTGGSFVANNLNATGGSENRPRNVSILACIRYK